LIGEINTGGGTLRVHVEDDLAFVIDFGEQDSYGLIIVDISNASDPVIVGSFHDGGLPFAIESVGDIVYIADQVEGLRILNISNVSNPVQIEGYSGGGSYDMEIVDNLLLLADDDNGLVILNISIPSEPVFVSSYGSRCIHLAVEGSVVYATINGLSLIDISDPEHPSLISNIEDGTGFWDPSVSDSVIYIANHDGHDGELQVIDASNPSHPERLSEFDSEGKFQSFFAQDSFLYAVDYETGLYLLNVSNPSTLQVVNRFSDCGRPWDVTVHNDYVLLCGSRGLQILQKVLLTIY